MHDQTDVQGKEFGFPCTLKKDTAPSLLPLLVLHLARPQHTFHAQQDPSYRDLTPVQQLPAALHVERLPLSPSFLKHPGYEYFEKAHGSTL